MSNNKMATKADLQELYQRILPYLGGMPEVLANKFSKGDMYSADEKMIGQWVDGKPLYQKTFTTTISTRAAIPTNTQFWEGSISLPSGLNVDRCWVDINHSTYLANPSNPSTRRGFDIAFYEPDNNDIYFVVLYERTNVQAEFVIQYTKTTDSPISIGNDTDYSTDEKIIGTWIDGKPLWQKTIELSSLSVGDNTITHGISNFGHLVNAFGYVVRGSIGEPIPKSSTANIGWNIGVTGFSNTQFYVEIGSSYVGQYAITGGYVTLQYTKTS